jgi:myo-inositol-hexaphosphate 3-phosphohydrolase
MSRFLPSMIFERLSPLTVITLLLLGCVVGFVLLPAMVGASPGTVMPYTETKGLPAAGNVTDSPVIWVNNDQPTDSLLIGGDSKGGLAIYNLAGDVIRHFADSKVHSPDLRRNIKLGGRAMDLVTGNMSADNTIAILQFDAQTPQFKNIALRKLKPKVKLYKSCMYYSVKSQKIYFFAIAKNGEVEQWELFEASAGQMDGVLVRAFDIGSQVDSCVADDGQGMIYFAEKRQGIWRYPAEPTNDAAPLLVDKTEGKSNLKASVEALALYGGGENEDGYLIASSDSGAEYVVYRRNRNNDYVTTFQVIAGNGVDAVATTEGLAAISTALGPAFPQGLLVVHDEENDAENKQNYKLISWQTVANFITPTPASAADAVNSGSQGTPSSPATTRPAGQTSAKGAHQSRGYQTTPQELQLIKKKADQGLEPYKTTVADLFVWADRGWGYKIKEKETCKDADRPIWLDDSEGTPILYAKALAFHLSGNVRYAEEVKSILQRIMTEAKQITLDDPQCQLNFGWGTPELVATADLIDTYWQDQICTGPTSTLYDDVTIGSGDCKTLFQNWLVKNPYYVVSYSAANNQSNWGAAATNTTAHIADYLWDRPDVKLLHRNPRQVNAGKALALSPREAFILANKQMIDRMNGYAVEYGSNYSCDYLSGTQQNPQWPPVKSQITENGVIPEDARREESCNVPHYSGIYENYPQVHLGNNIQQCELLLRRGDNSCYENMDNTDISDYSFVDPDGKLQKTHLRPGRGSIERAIKAIIVDAKTEWKHESALQVAYRYYYKRHKLDGFAEWAQYIDPHANNYDQDICFGALTHGFAADEIPELPPTVSPP